MGDSTKSSPYEIAFYPPTRQETYTFGLTKELYSHAYFLEKLLRVTSIENAKAFLDEFDNPIIYQILAFDQYSNTCDKREVPSWGKAEFIFNEANLLKKMVEQAQDILNIKKSLERKIAIDKKNNLESFSDSYLINLASAELTVNEKMSEIITKSRRRLSEITLEPTVVTRDLKQKITSKVRTITIENGREVSTHSHPEFNAIDVNTTFEITLRYITHDFLAIPWLELLETLKNNLPINKCKSETCNNFYFDALKPETSKYCKVCGPPSRRHGSRPSDVRKRNSIKAKIQRGSLGKDEGNKQLREQGLLEYEPRKEAKKKKNNGGATNV